jgi:hypothetical protein
MTMTMMTRIKKPLLIFGISQLGAAAMLVYSASAYVNFAVAMTTTTLIVMGSLYSYRNMITRRTADVDPEDNKDIIDMMDDPYDLYEEERAEEIEDIKRLIKEEKARQRANIVKNTTQNASAWVSAYRLIPYAFLILGFVALENNGVLNVLPYLIGLAAGIPVGYLIAKKLFILES